MKFVKQISLGDRIFAVEEDALVLLENYLQTIRQKYVNSPDVAEDFESRISDYLWEWRASHNWAVRAEDVQRVIAILGNANEFDSSEQRSFTTSDTPKHFYRDLTNRKIGGVCGGLGHYLNVDPLIFRLIFGIGLLFAFTSFWVYLIIWVVTPAKQFPYEN